MNTYCKNLNNDDDNNLQKLYYTTMILIKKAMLPADQPTRLVLRRSADRHRAVSVKHRKMKK